MSPFVHPPTPQATRYPHPLRVAKTSQPETAAIASPVSLSTEMMTILGIS